MKVDCKKCGAKILRATHKKNKGLCMPCKSGYRDQIIEMAEREGDEEPVRLYVKLTEQVLYLPDSEVHANIHLIEECIHSLEKAFKALTPPKKWWSRFRLDTGVNWLEGAGIANCAAEVAGKLEGMDLLELEFRSTNVWVGAVLAVCSHYHHLVGPAMIADAKIAERKGNSDRVKQVCHAVIQDFEVVLSSCEGRKLKPQEEHDDYTSLKSLEYALNKYIEIGAADRYAHDMKERLEKVWLFPQKQP
ncbi:hypothetical protein EOL70_00915 [Leucothrix sargassi]|nr:hypothetical protein EOL70_00915 [Leucothrix sargassi]